MATDSETVSSPTRESVERWLRQWVSRETELPLEEVRSENDLFDDLGLDSLSVVEMQMAAEKAFSVTIADDRADRIRTIGEATNAVMESLDARVTAA